MFQMPARDVGLPPKDKFIRTLTHARRDPGKFANNAHLWRDSQDGIRDIGDRRKIGSRFLS